MKILLITIFFLLTLFAVQAEERPAPRESFATFWASFKSAVEKNDKEAVVAATDLPSFYPNKPLAKAAFLKDYASIFSKEVQKCFATAKPVRDRDSYSVFCGEEYYYFSKVNATYKLTDIGMND